jgi:hypothetical protein
MIKVNEEDGLKKSPFKSHTIFFTGRNQNNEKGQPFPGIQYYCQEEKWKCGENAKRRPFSGLCKFSQQEGNLDMRTEDRWSFSGSLQTGSVM